MSEYSPSNKGGINDVLITTFANAPLIIYFCKLDIQYYTFVQNEESY